MLDTIKQALKKQSAYLEAAGIIFEDSSGRNLDDEIVLGGSNPLFEADEDDMEMDLSMDDTEGEEDDSLDTTDEPMDDTSMEEEPIDDEEVPPAEDGTEAEVPDETDEPMTSETGPEEINPEEAEVDTPDTTGENEEPMPLPGDELGGLGGEPVDDLDDDEFTSVDIDLQSNTVKDILPVPPSNAAEAIEGDSMETHVDSGFGGEEPTDDTSVPAPEDGEASLEGDSLDSEPTGDETPEVPEGDMGTEDEGLPNEDEGAEGSLPDNGIGDEDIEGETMGEAAIDSIDRQIKALQEKKAKLLMEAITLGGDPNDPSQVGEVTSDPNAAPAPGGDPLVAAGAAADAATQAVDPAAAAATPDPAADPNAAGAAPADPAAGGGQENAVTAAVRDQVSNTSSGGGTDFGLGDGSDLGSSLGSSDTLGDSAATIFKKLSGLSKNLEDIKADIFNTKM